MFDRELSLKLFNKYLFRIPSEDELKHHKITSKNYIIKEDEFRNCNERKKILMNDGYLNLEKNINDCIKNKDDFNSIQNINEFSWENISSVLNTYNISCKIAFCISGFVRNYASNFYLFERMLKYNPDIYIHTWDKEGKQSVERYNNFSIPVPILNNNIDINDVKNRYKPKDILCENFDDVFKIINKPFLNETFVYKHQANPVNIYSQLYSNNKSFELLKNSKIDYDIVVKMRFDYYQESIPNSELLNVLFHGKNNKNIYVPSPPYNCHDHKPCTLCENGEHIGEHNMDVCDVFAFGSQKNMNHYFNLYNEAENLVKNYNYINDKSWLKTSKNFLGNYIVEKVHIDQDSFCFYPEKLLRFHLLNYRLIGSHSRGKIMRN